MAPATPADAHFWVFNEVSAVLLSALIATVIAIWGIISQRGITARQATLEFMRATESDRDMIAARATFNRLAKANGGLGPWAIQPLTKEFKHIRMVLNEYEMVAIALQRGILDDTIYRRWYRSGIIQTWNYAAPFILTRRNETGNQTLWHEFEELARWYRGTAPMPKRGFFWGRFF